MAIVLKSSVFKNGEVIPPGYTADGPDASPPLEWSSLPPGTVELALICDDPDAPRAEPWVHWVVYAIPAVSAGFLEGVPKKPTLDDPEGTKQGVNDFGRVGYGGPAPPRGHGVHRYHFRLYALDRATGLPARATKAQLVAAMKGHILDEGLLLGTYSR
jgi:Raf kinase inhibitor-like YbhB/YbcL family protein